MKILYYVAGSALVVIGAVCVRIYYPNGSIVWALGAIIGFIGGGYLLWKGISGERATSSVKVGRGLTADLPKGKANSLNIYADKDESGVIRPQKIIFEALPEDQLKGQPWQCTNDNQWYYVHQWNIETKQLDAFALPDSQYFDPAEMARVLKCRLMQLYLP